MSRDQVWLFGYGMNTQYIKHFMRFTTVPNPALALYEHPSEFVPQVGCMQQQKMRLHEDIRKIKRPAHFSTPYTHKLMEIGGTRPSLKCWFTLGILGDKKHGSICAENYVSPILYQENFDTTNASRVRETVSCTEDSINRGWPDISRDTRRYREQKEFLA